MLKTQGPLLVFLFSPWVLGMWTLLFLSSWPLVGLPGGLSTLGKLSFSLSVGGRSLPKLVFQSRMGFFLILSETLFFGPVKVHPAGWEELKPVRKGWAHSNRDIFREA